MIDVLMTKRTGQHPDVLVGYNSHRNVGNLPAWLNYRSGYKMNPLGRHPFNIITEEIYG